jgi:hypothetical protein
VEFFIDIHAAIDYANDGNLPTLDSVKDQVQTDDQTAQAGRKAGAFPSYKWKSKQILEIGINPSNERICSLRIALLDIAMDMK